MLNKIICCSALSLFAVLSLSNCASCGGAKVEVGGVIRLTLPDGWRTMPSAHDDLDAAVYLANSSFGAFVRVIPAPGVKLTPLEAARILLPELAKAHYGFLPSQLPAEDHGQDVVITYQNDLEDDAGKLIVKAVPGRPDLIAVFVGVCLIRYTEAAFADLDSIAASVQAIKK